MPIFATITDTMNTQVPLWVLVLMAVYSIAVQAMPRPTAESKPVYVWIYQTLHGIAGNLRLLFDPLKNVHVESVTVTQTRTDTAAVPAPATPADLTKLSALSQLPVADHDDKK